MAPTPLPGYASLDELSTYTLLESAWTGFANPRKTQNDAAVAALQIVFARVVLAGTSKDEPTAAVAFVTDVADRLEQELQRVEGAIQGGLEDLALHGPVAGCRCVSMSSYTWCWISMTNRQCPGSMHRSDRPAESRQVATALPPPPRLCPPDMAPDRPGHVPL